jgi:hypothetical protein
MGFWVLGHLRGNFIPNLPILYTTKGGRVNTIFQKWSMRLLGWIAVSVNVISLKQTLTP